MGVNLFRRSSDSYWASQPTTQSKSQEPGDPDPKIFKVEKALYKGNIVLAKINYPNCTNYEGNKILVMSKDDYEKALESKILDPHFSDKGQSVIARFEPTEKGWNLAIDFINNCSI